MVKGKDKKAKKGGGKSNGQPKLKPGQKLNKMDKARAAKLVQKREFKVWFTIFFSIGGFGFIHLIWSTVQQAWILNFDIRQ